MKFSLATLAFALRASALVTRQTCTFSLTASGGVSGTVGQLSDGQNRVGGGYTPATYSISNGQITDSQKRGCILTPPTTQFQCDVGAQPTSGFAIGSNGQVTYNGSGTFYACPAASGIYNIYTTPVAGQAKCVTIQLAASGCYTATSSKAVSSTKLVTSSVPAYKNTTTTVKPTTQPTPVTSKPVTPVTPVTPGTPVPVTPVTTTVKAVTTSPVQSSCPAPVTVTVTVTQGAGTSVATQLAPTPQSSSSAPKPATSAPASTKPVTSSPATTVPASQKPSTASTSSTKPATTTVPVTPPFTNSTKGCPFNLPASYQYPHLIVPVSSAQPSKAYGTSYFASINASNSTIFNFDIPTSYTGTCSLVFAFPTQSQLQTSSFTFSGAGTVDFKSLSTIASQSTTYASVGGVKTDFGVKTVTPGTSTVVSTFACPKGQTVSYELSAVGDTALYYFQDYNPCPIGLYITTS